MNDRDYCYPPDFVVLRNKLNLRDFPTLEAIHRHLFQDVYEWAGEVRTVEIGKEGSRFQPRRIIEAGMADIHRRVVAAGYFRSTGPAAFADGAGSIMGDVNHVHPFCEGNGRTQLQYLKQLARRAGHRFDLTRLDGSLPAFQPGRSRRNEALYPPGSRVSVRPRSSGGLP